MSNMVLHIPHSSKEIPDYLRKDILLSDNELQEELITLTDLYTDIIFTGYETVKAEFSRFVCDVERFEDDSQEEMSKLGMGAVYIKTPTGKQLRHFDESKRNHIIETYYRPHHNKLEQAVKNSLEQYNECFIIDCYSFNENTNYVDMSTAPEICIGSDKFHTPENIVQQSIEIFKSYGFTVEINNPFSGSLVPLSYYNKDSKVKSMMIEINKSVYIKSGEEINESGMNKLKDACN